MCHIDVKTWRVVPCQEWEKAIDALQKMRAKRERIEDWLKLHRKTIEVAAGEDAE